MLVECVRTFLDAETGELRTEGERFEVTSERFLAVNGTKYGQLVVEVGEKVPEAVSGAKTGTKRTARRRKTKTQE